MEGKFAVLSYGKESVIKKKSGIFGFMKKKELEIEMEGRRVLGVNGYNVTLPVTEDEEDGELMERVYESLLERLGEMGVKALVAAKGSKYKYDHIIPAVSGFYILPFLLPAIVKKCGKILGNDNFELLIADGIKDLTIDILCLVCQYVNRITVLTEETEMFERTAEKFYADSGLNIYVTDKETDASEADVIFNGAFKDNKLLNKYKKNSIYLDMVGSKNKTTDIAASRQDMTVADGAELKTNDGYINNVLLEAVLLADDENFRAYMNGHYGNTEFYKVLDRVESFGLRLTTLKLFGANAAPNT